jgi:hypothetical protein
LKKKGNDEYLSRITFFFEVVSSKPSNLSIVGKKHACYCYWNQLYHHCHHSFFYNGWA